MDDNNIEELLKTWALPQDVIDLFKNNGVSTELLKFLTDDNLKELCPALGYRIILKNKIAEYLEATTSTEAVSESDTTLQSAPVGEISFTIQELFEATNPGTSSFPDFDLKTLLHTSPCGKSIVEYYKTHNGLDGKRRNRLTDIIIRHLFTYIVNKRLTYDDYNVLTSKIIGTFPKECPGIYFTHPVRKADSSCGKSVAARGKLVDKVRNILFQSCERKRDNPQNETETANKKQKCDLILRDFHKEDIDWLQENTEPWESVKEKWGKTFHVRHGIDYENVHDFISQWNVLKDSRAADLIDADFTCLFPDKGDNFIQYWNDFYEKFVSLKRHELIKDDSKETLLTSLNNIETDDAKLPTQLKLLINTVPPKGRISKNSKFSTEECLESIIVHIKNAGDIQTIIQNQIKKASEKKLQVQPYIIALGETLTDILQVYLVIDELRYTFDTVQRALDILFKCFHVLNAKYPKASEHIYLIIQQCVYKIITKFDKPAPYISDILEFAK